MSATPNQYVVSLGAAEASRPAPAVGRRIMLLIQNTGANPGQVRFGNPVRGDGGDFTLTAGQYSPLWDQPETTPDASINFFSTLGTTFAVLELVVRS